MKYLEIIRLKYLNNQILHGGVILFFLLNLGNLFSYISIVLISRNLIPLDLAEYSYVNSIILYFATPTVILTLFTAKRVINLKFHIMRTYVFYVNILISFIYSTITLTILYFFSKEIGVNSEYIYLIFFSVLSNLINGICLGYYQGMEEFKSYAFFGMLTMFIKLIFLIILIYFEKINPLNIIIFSLVSIILDNTLMFLNLNKKHLIKIIDLMNLFKKVKLFILYLGIFSKDIIYLLFGYFLVNLLFGFDIFIAKFYLNESDFIKYIPISILSKIPFFLSNTISPMLYPLISKKFNKNKNIQTVIITVSSIFISLVVLIFFYFFGNLIIDFTFNNQFDDLYHLLLLLSFSFSLLSVINLIFNYFAPSRNYYFLISVSLMYLLYYLITHIYFETLSIQEYIKILIYMFISIITISIFIGIKNENK